MGLTCVCSWSGSLLMPTESVLATFSLELVSSLHPLVLPWDRGSLPSLTSNLQISRRCLEPTVSDHFTDT